MKEGLCRKCVGRVVFFEGGEGDMQNASKPSVQVVSAGAGCEEKAGVLGVCVDFAR